MPGEAEKAAQWLGVSLREFFDTYLGVDWWDGEPPVFVLAPAIVSMEPGSEYPADPRGRCVFYENGLCKIHPVKPYECAFYHHSDSDEVIQERHRRVAEAWKEHQEQIKNLLGREPEALEWDMFSALFALL